MKSGGIIPVAVSGVKAASRGQLASTNEYHPVGGALLLWIAQIRCLPDGLGVAKILDEGFAAACSLALLKCHRPRRKRYGRSN